MVLLILVAIWAIVLIPPWIRSRRDVRPARSMVSFQHRLSTLERTMPSMQAYPDVMYLDGSSRHELGPGVDDDDPAGGVPVDVTDDDPVDAVASGAAEWGSVAYFRPREVRAAPVLTSRVSSRVALHRRRQTFLLLLVGVVVSLGVAAGLNSLAGWAVHGGISLLFLGYVALLVRHHQRSMDRAAKVRYLTPTRAPRPAVVVLHGTAR